MWWLQVLCVGDMSLTRRLGFDASLSEGAGEVVAEHGVLGSEVVDLDVEGVESGFD